MKKRLIVLSLIVIMLFSCGFSVSRQVPIVDKSQALQCIKDRNATQKFINSIDFIYEYSKKMKVDPSIVVVISCLETGYGKSNLFRNLNNPGGIKAVKGWRKFKTIEDGYKYMIDLLATYAGVNDNTDSYLYGVAKTTQDLGKYYWIENGVDKGYHDKVTTMIRIMQSYPKETYIKNPIQDKKKKSFKVIKMLEKILGRTFSS